MAGASAACASSGPGGSAAAGSRASSAAGLPRPAPVSSVPARNQTGAGLRGGRQVEPVGPARVRRAVPEHPPRRALGRDRVDMQTPAELGWRTVALGVVAPGAGGYHVLPRVPAATAAWEYVVYGLR